MKRSKIRLVKGAGLGISVEQPGFVPLEELEDAVSRLRMERRHRVGVGAMRRVMRIADAAAAVAGGEVFVPGMSHGPRAVAIRDSAIAIMRTTTRATQEQIGGVIRMHHAYISVSERRYWERIDKANFPEYRKYSEEIVKQLELIPE